MNKLILALAVSLPCYGGALLINSTPGVEMVAITPHPLWQQNNPQNPWVEDDTSAVWVSYGDTGYGGAEFQPHQGEDPVYIFRHEFAAPAGWLNLKVWADDTFALYFDGAQIFAPNFTQNICADGPGGCEPGEYALISTLYSGGSHILDFVTYQTGTGTNTIDNPFGLLYTGAAVYETPEPGTCLLAGFALLSLGWWGKRRKLDVRN